MPFVSENQRRYLWKNKPELARRWADEEKARKAPKIKLRPSTKKR